MRNIISRTFTTHTSKLINVETEEVVQEKLHERKPKKSTVIRNYLKEIDTPIPLRCEIESEKARYVMTRERFMELAEKEEKEF